MTHARLKKILMLSCVSFVFGAANFACASTIQDEASQEINAPNSLSLVGASEENKDPASGALVSPSDVAQPSAVTAKPKKSLLRKVITAPFKLVATPIWWLWGTNEAAKPIGSASNVASEPTQSLPKTLSESAVAGAPEAQVPQAGVTDADEPERIAIRGLLDSALDDFEGLNTEASTQEAGDEDVLHPLAYSISPAALEKALEHFGDQYVSHEELMAKMQEFKLSLKTPQEREAFDEKVAPMMQSVMADNLRTNEAGVSAHQLAASVMQGMPYGPQIQISPFYPQGTGLKSLVTGQVSPRKKFWHTLDLSPSQGAQTQEVTQAATAGGFQQGTQPLEEAKADVADEEETEKAPPQDMVMTFMNFLLPDLDNFLNFWSGDN
ncbi:MAG: hypothetical protein ACK5O7_01880 [Holosporales bacterium]